MTEDSRPELNWDGEKSAEEEEENKESSEGLCKVEDPTCEACQ